MGCAASKKAVSVTPAVDSSGILQESFDGLEPRSWRRRHEKEEMEKVSSSGACAESFRLGNLHRYIEGEQVAAGWPSWLSAVAGEAIRGWVPLKADSFEKLEKIGQGTYSSVFRARDLETGKIVALKKVRFDNFEPESVRFMAREIQILRRLQHPNIVKLEGLITSRLSSSIYFVFEYMEHDLAGLSSCPDIKFTEPQIKCYMHQLLSGLEHCHSQGVIHRDIKGANLLVNNEGILKIADFGLANISNPANKQPLTSRVVTLWYRPPELLLGSTDYEATVDLWSVGCVFAEMFLGKPILQGRTEVEQLHKIFKICGSPADEYWKKSKLPHATIFKPHHPYASCLQETFKCLPATAFSLLETFLSVDPCTRGTASSALESEYFRTKPYACEPSSLPKYPPNKEIDAKSREESRRNRATGNVRGSEEVKRSSRTYRASRSVLSKLAAHPEESRTNTTGADKPGGKLDLPSSDGDTRLTVHPESPSANVPEEGRGSKHKFHGDIPFSGPLHVTASSGFAWAKKEKEDHPYVRSQSKSNTRTHSLSLLGPSSTFRANGDPKALDNVSESHEMTKHTTLKKWTQLERPDSFDYSGEFNSQGYKDQEVKVEFSGPLLSQSHKVDQLLEKHERHMRQAVRRSWFQRVAGRSQGK